MASNRYRIDDKFYISDLRLKIFVIGYGCYGESTVLLLSNGDVVNYSVVIDSYQYKKDNKFPYINKAIDLLRKHHVKHLDLLCWTHPHDDHSKGLVSILNSFCDEDTDVLYPMYVENNASDIVQLNLVSKETVNRILEINRDGLVTANPIGVKGGRYNNVDEFDIVNPYDEEEIRHVRVDVLTPISSKLTKYVNNAQCTDPNELSITMILDIDGYGFYFGGDTTNEHIDDSNKSKMGKCRFVKIPHHSSSTANHLLHYLPVDQLDAVCTTVFNWGKSKLPEPTVIKEYQKYFEDVYTTNKDLRRVDYGIIEYEYDFNHGYPVCEVREHGNVGKMEMV